MANLDDLAAMLRNMGGLNADPRAIAPPPGTPVRQGVAGPPWEALLGLAGMNSKPQPGVQYGMVPTGPGGITPSMKSASMYDFADPVKAMMKEGASTRANTLEQLMSQAPGDMYKALKNDQKLTGLNMMHQKLIDAHGHPTKIENGRLMAEETLSDKDRNITHNWVDMHDKTYKQIRDWLGY